ncbi:MAG: DUF2892 domain-containing protein [Flavobacteriales bacterium]|nr:DUF2892 domain-containing protein [Flavobacteriales bacterium]
MISRIIRISVMVALICVSVWQFFEGNIGNGIFCILLMLIVLFTYFKNEWMIMTMFAMRKNNLDKAKKYLSRIKDPDHALVRRERATYYFLQGAVISQTNMTESEKLFKKSLEIGLSQQEQAMAKLQLSAIALQKGRKPEAERLLADAKRLDKGNLLDEQITMIKQGLKRSQGQPNFFQQQQMRGARRR